MEYFCEMILNLGQWLRRIHQFKIFLFLALVAILFNMLESFVQYW